MKRPESPCKGCKDRRLGCHADCKAETKTYNSIVSQAADYGQVVTYSRTQLKRMGRIK